MGRELGKPCLCQGLGLDPKTCAALTRLGLRDIFEDCSQPIPVEEYRWVDSTKKAVSLIKNDKHLHRRFELQMLMSASSSTDNTFSTMAC